MIYSTKLWRKLLDEAPPNSALMGGAIIDSLFGIKPKDYDIFHPYVPGMPEVPVNWKWQDVPLGGDEHLANYQQGLAVNGIAPIGSVYNYIVDGEFKIQLIGIMGDLKPVEHFKNFDHSLTLGRYTKSGVFIHEKVFESWETRTIEFVGKNKTKERREKSFVRALKKAERYGGEWKYKGFKPE